MGTEMSVATRGRPNLAPGCSPRSIPVTRPEHERIADEMTSKHPRNGKAKRPPPRAAKPGWQVAKNVYGVIFLVVVIYVGINLLRG